MGRGGARRAIKKRTSKKRKRVRTYLMNARYEKTGAGTAHLGADIRFALNPSSTAVSFWGHTT